MTAYSIDNIKRVVADDAGITVSMLVHGGSDKVFSHPRQIAMYLTRFYGKKFSGKGFSYPEIGRHFGKKDHTTVIYSCQTVEKHMAEDAAFARRVAVILYRLNCEHFKPRQIADASELFPMLALVSKKIQSGESFEIPKIPRFGLGSIGARPDGIPSKATSQIAAAYRAGNQFSEAQP